MEVRKLPKTQQELLGFERQFSQVVDFASGSVDIRIAQWDRDGGLTFDDDRCDISPDGDELDYTLDLAACTGRFEILSRTDNINFASGSAALEPQSAFLLDSIADIVARCPGLRIVVAGHTDSDGARSTNQRQSPIPEGRGGDSRTRRSSPGVAR